MNSISKFNKSIKNQIITIISFLILLQPIIDLIVGVSIKVNFFPTIMSLIRMVILIFFLYYFFFINKSKDRKKITIFLMLIAIYLICYSINLNFSFEEIKSAIKVFYFPTLLLILVSIFDEEKRFIDKKYFLYALSLYALIIIVGFLTNTAFKSYEVAKEGTSGYFNAANEVGAIISLLLPFVFDYVFKKINIKKLLYFGFIVIAIIILGTKTPFISLFICTVYSLVKLINKKNIVKVSVISIAVIIGLSFIVVKTPIYENMMIHAKFLKIDSVVEFIQKPELIDHFLLGSRLKFLGNNNLDYLDSDISDKLLGMGYVNNPKLAEMDIYDVFYRQGIIGFGLFLTMIISVFMSGVRTYNKEYILPIVLVILISTFVGHVITAPAVSTFVVLITCGLLKEEVA